MGPRVYAVRRWPRPRYAAHICIIIFITIIIIIIIIHVYLSQ